MSDSDEGGRGPPSKKKKKVTEKRTHRCKVDLSAVSSDTYSEVSWYDLLAKEAKKNKGIAAKKAAEKEGEGGSAATALDPYGSDDDEQLKALAAQFEKKYAEPSKKKVKKRKEFDDLGDGYDESDPFIDNSECFDETVPQEITTAFGGFYINTGILEFKSNKNVVYELSDSSDDTDTPTSTTEKKKEKKMKKENGGGGGPGIPIKKAKMINTKRKARMITTAVGSGPSNGTMKKPDDVMKKPLPVKTDPDKKPDKSGQHSSGPALPTVNSSIKITPVLLKDESKTELKTKEDAKQEAKNKNELKSKGETKSKTDDTKCKDDPRKKDETKGLISVKASSELMGPKLGSAPGPKPASAPRDLKSERKGGTNKSVGQSSPKPPELIDLENQLNALSGESESTQSTPVSKGNSMSSNLSKSSSSSSVNKLPSSNCSSFSISRLSSPAVVDKAGTGSNTEKGPSSSNQLSKSTFEPGKSTPEILGKSKMATHSSKNGENISTDFGGKTERKTNMYSHDPASILSSFSQSDSAKSNSSITKTVTASTDKKNSPTSLSSGATSSNPLQTAGKSNSSSYSFAGPDLKKATLTKVSSSPRSIPVPTNTQSQSMAVLAKVNPKSQVPIQNSGKAVTAAATTKLSGSELSQQLGRQAVQQLVQNLSKNPSKSDTSPGISVKSIYSESQIGITQPYSHGQQVSPGKQPANGQYSQFGQMPANSQQLNPFDLAKLSQIQAQQLQYLHQMSGNQPFDQASIRSGSDAANAASNYVQQFQPALLNGMSTGSYGGNPANFSPNRLTNNKKH